MIQLLPELLKQPNIEVVDGVSGDGVEKVAAWVLESGVNSCGVPVSVVARGSTLCLLPETATGCGCRRLRALFCNAALGLWRGYKDRI